MFAGDPHGNFTPILRACMAREPGALILVGDCDCPQPLPNIMRPAIDAGWTVHWILGNHDTETERGFDNLAMAHPEGNIGFRVVEISGLRIAGLPGVFRPRVWQPNEPPQFQTRVAFQASLPASDHWRGGLPLFHRDSIFPDDFRRLRRQRFDILVAHEAPSSHPHGFAAIDDLALACGARLIVHGHHHLSYVAELPNGIQVRGLGLAETWSFEADRG